MFFDRLASVEFPSHSVPLVSVVIPVYCAVASLRELVARLEAVLEPMTAGRWEVILVDDCSPDDTWLTLCQLKSENNPRLRIARLQRNSGQHNAILCGFSLVRGNVVVTMDDDLQNPPEEIPRLVSRIEQGYDLVIGAYEIKKHTMIRNFSGGIVDNLIRWMFSLPAGFQLTSFRAVRRDIVANVCQMGGVFPYVTTMLLTHASRCINEEVRHETRKHGTSNYDFRRSIRLAANLIISYSTLPVMLVGVLCLGAFVFSVLFGSWVLVDAMLSPRSVQGWASTIVIVSFFNALNLMCLFIFAVYLSRMNQQMTRSRVSFTISELHD